jgi:tetrahydromethanopterin S-methyltransferase subunit F
MRDRLSQEAAMRRAEKLILTKGLIAGAIIGLSIGLIVALFVIMRQH